MEDDSTGCSHMALGSRSSMYDVVQYPSKDWNFLLDPCLLQCIPSFWETRAGTALSAAPSPTDLFCLHPTKGAVGCRSHRARAWAAGGTNKPPHYPYISIIGCTNPSKGGLKPWPVWVAAGEGPKANHAIMSPYGRAGGPNVVPPSHWEAAACSPHNVLPRCSHPPACCNQPIV